MAAIANYFEQAQLSLTSYALNLQRGMFGAEDFPEYVAAVVDAGMSVKQGEVFANTYAVVDQFSDPVTGFSATVFDKGGVKYFAIRGTEGFTFAAAADWLTNVLDVSAEGIALRQGLALLNYLQRLYAAPNNAVVQYFYNPIDGTIGTTTGTANGLLSGSLAPLSVAGHSLGGHLAMMMSRLVPDLVSSVSTYNAPGFDTAIRTNLFPLTSEGFFSLLRNAPIGPITGAIGTAWNSSIMTHLDVEGDVVHNIGNTPGTQNIIFSENANQGAFDAHLKEPITDSLALYDLFAKIDSTLNTTDPAVGIGKITDILKAASNKPALSLEAGLDALRTLFKNPAAQNLTPTATDDRDAFYTNLYETEFQTRISGYTNLLSIESLVDKNATTIEASAYGDLTYRYALKALNPFTILGEEGIYDQHNQNGELDLYDPVNRTGTLTVDWITDRAKLLYADLIRNTQDIADAQVPVRLPGSGDTATEYHHYRGGKEEAFFAEPAVRPPGAIATQMVMFADDTGRFLIGTDNLLGDRLYGGAGTDYLIGKANNDSLEGGKGLDIYQYNASGSANDGADTIRDTDGKGVLRYTYTPGGLFSNTVQSTVIADASVKDGAIWRSADGKFNYEKQGADLVVTILGDAGGSLTLKDFKDGDFGIRLWEARPAPQTTNTINADVYPDNQTIFDTAANDLILGDARNNGINASSGGSNCIQAGPGRDTAYALTALVSDVHLIEGGAGDDLLAGGAGNDELYADTRVDLAQAISAGGTPGNGLHGDWLSGGWGDDVLVGDLSNDGFSAGRGKDIIVAGGGDDNIFGDADWIATTLDWYYEDDPVGGQRLFYFFNGAENYDVGEADIIYGGAGNDYVWSHGGDDLVYGEQGHDTMVGGGGSDVLIGGADDDLLEGDDPRLAPAQHGDDYLDGGAGNDVLWGDGGNDVLIGGPGNDTLNGGAGRDIYVFNKGDGTETVFDTDANSNSPDASVLVLGDGVSRGNIKFKPGSLAVDIGPSDPADPNSPHDTIHFNGFDQLNPTATTPLGEIRFADGTSMSYADILAQGFDIDGTEDSDDNHDTAHPQLVGTGVTDRIRGFGGNDVLFGLAGDDMLDGGDGADQLVGGPGADTIHGGAGDDQIWADGESGGVAAPDGSDVVYGGAGNDIIQGYGGDDQLFGDGDNDTLYGGFGDDTLDGGAGDDQLVGNGGNDTLIGGIGTDILQANAGSDTYLIARGDGSDIIADIGDEFDLDSLVFSADIDPAEVVLRRWNNELRIDVGDGGSNHIEVREHFRGDGTQNIGAIEQIVFEFDGAIWDVETIRRGTLIGTDAGNDYLVGYATDDVIEGNGGDDFLYGEGGNDLLMGGTGNDYFQGGAGNDTLIGGSGNEEQYGGGGSDVYVYAVGDGMDSIREYPSTETAPTDVDILRFAPGVNPSDITLTRSVYDLLVTHPSSGGRVTVHNHFYPATSQGDYAIERIEFADGAVWDATTIAQMLLTATPGADTLYGSEGGDAINGLDGDDSIYGMGGNDTLAGNVGNDFLAGGYGADTYLFNLGDGRDSINGSAVFGHNDIPDTLQFGAGITPGNVALSQSGENLVLTVNGTSDEVTIVSYFLNWPNETITFADGTVWTDEMISRLFPINGTSGNDTILRYGRPDYINGLAGNDVLLGGGANDTLDGGLGSDTLYGEDGNDTLIAGAGESKNAAVSNSLYGGAGDDLLISSGKTDFLYGGSGNDILLGGGGRDWLEETGGNNLMSGSSGVDTIWMGSEKDLVIGGAGNDLLDGDRGADGIRGQDILMFNKSDGKDSVARLGSGSTISIGGGTLYSNLSLEMQGATLRLKTASSHYISLSDWYGSPGNKAVTTLQIVIEGTRDYKPTSSNPMLNQKVQVFDFLGLVAAFDAARATGKTFNVANNLATYRIGGSDTEMIGGAIAYQYARTGSLGTLTYSQMQAVINDPAFGVLAQPIAAPVAAAALDAGTAVAASADATPPRPDFSNVPDAAIVVDDTPTGFGVSGTQGDAAHAAYASASRANDAPPGATDALIEQWFASHSLNDDLTLLDEIARGEGIVNAPSQGSVVAAWEASHRWLSQYANARKDTGEAAADGADLSGLSLLGTGSASYDMPQSVVGLRNVSGHQLTSFHGLREGVSVLTQP